MKIKLIAGDHEWTLEGTHVCDEHGFAKILEEEIELDLADDVAARILPIIEYGRIVRGLMPNGSLPPPPQPEEVVEPVEPQPVEPPQPEEVVEPVEPQPVEPPQPEEVVEPVEPQPVEPPQPEEVVEPVETPQPVEPEAQPQIEL